LIIDYTYPLLRGLSLSHFCLGFTIMWNDVGVTTVTPTFRFAVFNFSTNHPQSLIFDIQKSPQEWHAIWVQHWVLCIEISLTSAGTDMSHCHDQYYHKTVQEHKYLLHCQQKAHDCCWIFIWQFRCWTCDIFIIKRFIHYHHQSNHGPLLW